MIESYNIEIYSLSGIPVLKYKMNSGEGCCINPDYIKEKQRNTKDWAKQNAKLIKCKKKEAKMQKKACRR